jgi:archaellum component FlaC
LDSELKQLKAHQKTLELNMVKLAEHQDHLSRMKTISEIHGTADQVKNIDQTKEHNYKTQNILSSQEQHLHGIKDSLTGVKSGLSEIKKLLSQKKNYKCHLTPESMQILRPLAASQQGWF